MSLTMKLLLGFILDLIFGDPISIPHPVRYIGWLIGKCEKVLRPKFKDTKNGQIIAGGITTLSVVSISTGVCYLILFLLGLINNYLRDLGEIIIIYQVLATKCLKQETMKVYSELKNNNLPEARIKLSYLVGRDTEHLNEEAVARATVETIAENTSDGVIAPLLFMAIGGAPFGILYKAINTLDSSIGYKNDKYLYFGRIAAKLDDVANFLPSRIAGIFLILAALFLGYDFKEATRIFLRDRYNHSSPNSAQTEAACAGALGIKLGGDNYYFGKLVHKKTIGDANKAIDCETIKKANNLLYGTSIIAIVIVCLLRYSVLMR
ncbi:adenosylcobinamide-phosphate synthase CbiB [Clostridium cellulovorans]|uniref:Cobalamin biosynthesis protein CobD n=1 Tax=Clostridium cellulovorans (strain ATCC 35296 / DSM 3052 / OCM 3 / 743B) TaxID=573061 RepID=D9SNZ6_CLOC7|nr:adenosylcobinamide-phosphate synthase CbiB [Clostridium cellulovorans]ADL51961.1 cobalamin biosynthesis protein CobD [Clostridium cellulovorans 743B]